VCERHTEQGQGGGEIDTRSAGCGETLVTERCSTARSIGVETQEAVRPRLRPNRAREHRLGERRARQPPLS
jgi:hypothetical protein